MQPSKKIRPIIPVKFQVTSKDNYRNYLKKRYKVIKELKISKPKLASSQDRKVIPILLKIFKIIKYTRKLDLRTLAFRKGHIFLSKILYFAKRTSHTPEILIHDNGHSKPLQSRYFKGAFDSWIKYQKRTKSCSYQLLLSTGSLEHGDPKFDWRFPRFLSYQPNIKDLTLSLPCNTAFLLKDLYLFTKYPASLQRLSLQFLNSEKPLKASLHHLTNLRYLELDFLREIRSDVLLSIVQLLPQVASSLQGLSLKWPEELTPHLFHAFSAFQSLTNLTKLKLYPDYYKIHKHPMMILEAFQDCPICHLELYCLIESEEELIPLVNFITKHTYLEVISVRILCCSLMSRNLTRVREMFLAIDELVLLKRLSVSFRPSCQKEDYFNEINPLFSKIFTKAIPLESFEVEMSFLLMTKEGFLGLLDSLKPISSGLKKLQIDLGKFKPERKQETDAVLGLIQSLKNIQSLRLVSLDIPTKQFLIELIKIIYGLRYIRELTIGEITELIEEKKFHNVLMEILQKRGLEVFECRIDCRLHRMPGYKKMKQNLKRNFGKVIKKNPSLQLSLSLDFYGFHVKGEHWDE